MIDLMKNEWDAQQEFASDHDFPERLSPRMVPILGSTYLVKDQLKALGARWDVTNKQWIIDASKLDDANLIVQSVPIPNGQKRCVECHQPFTRQNADRNAGDWEADYCGC